MNTNNVKPFFERLYKHYNTKKYIPTDPIRFPHEVEGNREFIAFTSAMFAYGNVKAMQKFLFSFFGQCGADPLTLEPNPAGIKYRFQSECDVADYCRAMKRIYRDHGGLEPLLGGGAPLEAAANMIKIIRDEYLPQMTRGLHFLLTLPGKSASKRLSMFLRWMIRKDEVDLGLWETFTPADLHMPIDTHIERLTLKMGTIAPKDRGAKALAKVNAFFRELNPEDPVKYDFALTRLGIALQCKYELSKQCAGCAENILCVFN